LQWTSGVVYRVFDSRKPTFRAPVLSRGFFFETVYFYLDKAVKLCYKQTMSPRLYTTREVARRAGISRQTLQAWIAEEKVRAPAVMRAAGVRLWTERDLAQVLKVKPRSYPRGAKAKKRD
jgi:excisionase family DNA binding protein